MVGVMAAPRKYPDEVRDRAVRLVLDVAESAGSVSGACRRVGEELGINADTLRGWVKQAQIDNGSRRGGTPPEAGPGPALGEGEAQRRRGRPGLLEPGACFSRSAGLPL